MGCLLDWPFMFLVLLLLLFYFSFLSLLHSPALNIWRRLASSYDRLGDSNEWLAMSRLVALKTMVSTT